MNRCQEVRDGQSLEEFPGPLFTFFVAGEEISHPQSQRLTSLSILLGTVIPTSGKRKHSKLDWEDHKTKGDVLGTCGRLETSGPGALAN